MVVGCSSPPDVSPRAPELAAYLSTVTASEVQTWRLDEAAWKRITVAPFRDLYTDYTAELDADAPKLVAQLGKGTVAVRDHFADDPELTLGQARTRWALPVLAKAKVATIGGAPLDAVFVVDGEHWRAIVGLDRIVTTRVRRFDAPCAARIDAPSPSHRCRSIAWQVADAALRNDRERFAHACSLAATLCGTPSP